MAYQITIEPSGHRFTAEAGETLLAAALREGFSLPYGCRNGACGSCKGRVLAGEFDHGNAQITALKPEEREAGKALFCCVHPQGDMVIEVREIGAARDIQIKTLPCRVHKLERLAHDVMRMQLKLPANERLQFLAGQFIDILLKDGRRRSYSLANAPHDDAFLELHLRHAPGGRFTDHVFGAMKEKDILRLEGPLGSFFIREETDKPLLFVAGGTGFAPIKSMIEHAIASNLQRQMVLYWGVRSLRDLYLADLPARWQHEQPNISFIPVLSEPMAEEGWPGRTGYVHQAVLDDFEDLSGWEVYVCGAPAMVEAAREGFTRLRGLPEAAFFADAFIEQRD
jgi:CDP-4-dehydro-6-deoxyglucose reductase